MVHGRRPVAMRDPGYPTTSGRVAVGLAVPSPIGRIKADLATTARPCCAPSSARWTDHRPWEQHLAFEAPEPVEAQRALLDLFFGRAVVVGGRADRGRALDTDEHDRSDPTSFEPAALVVEVEDRLVDGSLPMHGRCTLEAVALPADRIDDVDLDDRVAAFDVRHRLMRVEVGEHQVLVVPHRGRALR